MTTYKIYKHTSPSGKFYIGYTGQSVEKRWKDHCRSARLYQDQRRFYNALRYYEDDADWSTEILEEFEGSRSEATIKERKWIEKLHPEYNANMGGSGGWVVKDKKKWQKNLSKAMKGAGNPKYSGITDEEIIDLAVEAAHRHGRIIPIHRVKEETGAPIPKSLTKFRFNGLGFKGLYVAVENKTGMKYNPYYRSKEQRELAGKTLAETNRKRFAKNAEN